jgi:hypothetical protein
MERIKQVSKKAYNIALGDGWDEFKCCHGYGIFDGEYPTEFGMIEGQHIEKIDIMEVWDSDITAAQHAEEYEGIKIIRDIPNLYPVFIDTPENRAEIMSQIEEEDEVETKIYRVVVEEIQSYEVYVEADNEEEAADIAQDTYGHDGVVFSTGVSIVLIEEDEEE